MKLRTREMAVFAMLGTIMYASKVIMEMLPNIHLVGILTVVYTIVYRKKALYPIYIYVFLTGLFSGFATWWVAYLYIWTILWGASMLLPRNMSRGVGTVVYAVVCCLHGLFFGVLYAPAQALLFGLDFQGMLAWIAAGFVFDVIHAVSNLCAGLLIWPLSRAMLRIERRMAK
ncbi:MAG: hypothetical protein IJF79_07995 [Clostridia bacterium]|nr:hypothetical protein [Clostridia bacterium]